MIVRTRLNLLCVIWIFWACSGPARNSGAHPVSAPPEPLQPTNPGPAPVPDPVMLVPTDPDARDTVRAVQLSEPYNTRTIPGGVTCLIRLKRLGVPFRSLEQMNNVDTPVQITGPVNGILYKSMWRGKLICDCRFAVALHRAGLILRNLGVAQMHFSSSYRNSRLGSGRLSRHAMGLALDIHRVLTKKGDLLKVKEHYRRRLADGCMGSSPLLNRIGCLLIEWGVFDRALTPDYDRAHYNHYHFSILTLHRRRYPPKDGVQKPIED